MPHAFSAAAHVVLRGTSALQAASRRSSGSVWNVPSAATAQAAPQARAAGAAA